MIFPDLYERISLMLVHLKKLKHLLGSSLGFVFNREFEEERKEFPQKDAWIEGNLEVEIREDIKLSIYFHSPFMPMLLHRSCFYIDYI